jgi:CDP-glucose 4,6-dehydratase
VGLIHRLFEKYKFQTIFHLAAEAIVGRAYENPAEALDTNVRGTWNVLEVCRRKNPEAEVIIASSDKAYGTHAKLPYREDFPLLGENPYDCSKSAADRIALMYAKTYGTNLAITRCGNVYGGGDLNFSRLVPDAIRSLFSNKSPEIRSDGLFIRDYVHVSDIVGAYIRTAEALIKKEIQAGEAFNFGTNSPRTALEVVQSITTLMGHEIHPVILATARYEIRDQYLDSTKAREILGWAPAVGFENGLRDTIDWYSNYLSNGAVTKG